MSKLKEDQSFPEWANDFVLKKEDREVTYMMQILSRTLDADQARRMENVLNRELNRIGDETSDPEPLEDPANPKDWAHWSNWSMYGDEEEQRE